MNENTLFYWLFLSRLTRLSAALIQQLVDVLEREKIAVSSIVQTMKKLQMHSSIIDHAKKISLQTIEKEIQWSQQDPQHHLIVYSDPNYPHLLKQIASPPPVLYVRGNVDCLSLPQLSIVGSRNPTAVGRELATHFASQLSRIGFVITSGFAIGIDTSAHEGALQHGQTIAVLGSGLQVIYPKRNQRLVDAVTEQGALLSIFPLQTAPLREYFPQRNRIISGLSAGVLVIEATVRSGSLITARFAGEQGREIFAIPGSIHNPLSRGCHWLIRQGAKLVETTDDIVEELKGLLSLDVWKTEPDSTPKTSHKLDDEQKQLLDAMGYEITSSEALLERTDFSAEQIASMLLILELKDRVQCVNGGWLRKVSAIC
ncbi:MAG: DNA-processing protein DprA [Gammaproteobacteria bacterium]|nr:DNA-processing protein DprA [Gammaproteobacteria bacterium]